MLLAALRHMNKNFCVHSHDMTGLPGMHAPACKRVSLKSWIRARDSGLALGHTD